MELSKVSIIIPVYKAENSIEKCIKSILDQTYKKIELLLVDDGSPDKSGEICDKYQKDPHIKVFHTQNRGVSHARNVGLSYATGDYITFCDSDDFYDTHFVEKMLQSALKYNSDITICGYYLEEKGYFNSSVKSESGLVNKNEVIEHCSIDNEFGGFCWNKLYKAKVIGKNKFPEDMDIMEDTYFLCAVSKKAQSIYYLAEPLYYYCDNEDSSVRNINNLYTNNNTVKYIDAWKKVLTNFKIDEISQNYIYVSMIKFAINFRCQEKRKKHETNIKLISNLDKTILDHRRELYICKKITWYEKVKWTLKYVFPKLHKIKKYL